MPHAIDRNAQRIGGGYSRTQRLIEGACLGVFLVADLATFARAAGAPAAWWMLGLGPASCVLAALLADLVSGVVHWACDTWGSVTTPLLGKAFIRQFREHHVDPDEISHHDVIEANGTNGALALLPLALAWSCPSPLAHPGPLAWSLQVGVAVFALLVTFTSQAHQWAHARRVPALVGWCQRRGLMLSREHHAVHHRAPHLRHYCITGGWMDPLIERFALHRRAERAITALTGHQPRAGENAASPGEAAG